MPDLPSNSPGFEPDGPELPDFLDGSGDGDFLDLGQSAPESALSPIEPAASQQPAADPFSEQSSEALTAEAPLEEQPATADSTHDDVPDWALEEDEEGTMSWLMELDGTEGDDHRDGEDALGFGGEAGEAEQLQAASSGGNSWLVRAAIAGVSLGLGFAGARYFSQRGVQQPVVPVAQVETPTNTGAATQPTQNNTSVIQPQGGSESGSGAAAPTPNAQDGSRTQLVELGPLPSSSELEGPWRPDPSAFTPVITESTGGAPETVAESGATETSTTEGEPILTPYTAPTGEAIAVSESAPAQPEAATRPETGRNPLVRFTGPGRNPYLSFPPPFMTLDGNQPATNAGQPSSTQGPSVVVTHGTGTDVPTIVQSPEATTRVVRAPGGTSLNADDLGGGLREASTAELAGLWTAGSIPMNKISAKTRLMTPGVGRVRVLLTGGEVFEGDLYAVGESKVWIQSELGKMALLGWQVERIEHLLGSGGLPGSSPNASLEGLPSVRVRTPGGVFYGRLLEQRGESVTLLTEEGARLTLQDAEVDTAGRSTTHLVDATGAVEDEEPQQEEQ